MPGAVLFVDLPNFYSRLLKSGIDEPRLLRDYFLDWLDFDLLARSLTDSHSGIWIFYSGERIGPSGERIEGKYLQEYIRRINALEGVTARDVNIRGEQREAISYKCDNCGNEGISESVSEKGIDASLTVHLFDTMDSWDTAFLLSGDADFVPAVGSLRRKGKIVVGVGFSDASTALVRECYHYVNIDELFLNHDIFAYSLFKRDGVIQKWLTDKIIYDPSLGRPDQLNLRVHWGREGSYGRGGIAYSKPYSYWLRLDLGGVIDLESRHIAIAELKKKFPVHLEIGKHEDKPNAYTFHQISQLGYEAIKRRLLGLLSSIQSFEFIEMSEERGSGMVTFHLDHQTGEYKLLTK